MKTTAGALGFLLLLASLALPAAAISNHTDRTGLNVDTQYTATNQQGERETVDTKDKK